MKEMKINGEYYRTIWVKEDDPGVIQIIDQRSLPHELVIEDLETVEDCATAIREMHVRGAPLIGATAGYGMYLAYRQAEQEGLGEAFLDQCVELLKATRPTAVDLFHALTRMRTIFSLENDSKKRTVRALEEANSLAKESVQFCQQIGINGLSLIEGISRTKNGERVNILTHCNAGWLACVDYGTATAPIYAAFDKGIDVHVWVDETRPRNQGARLTAFELLQHGIPHTVIADNTGGHLMQHGMVDIVLVGSDRTTITGDVANKIGTYLKALAAKDNGVPFYVALPSSSFDWDIRDGLNEIPIEQRNGEEVKYIQGMVDGSSLQKVLLTPGESPAANFGFDVTPARLVSGLITERGVCAASEAGIRGLFGERGRGRKASS